MCCIMQRSIFSLIVNPRIHVQIVSDLRMLKNQHRDQYHAVYMKWQEITSYDNTRSDKSCSDMDTITVRHDKIICDRSSNWIAWYCTASYCIVRLVLIYCIACCDLTRPSSLYTIIIVVQQYIIPFLIWVTSTVYYPHDLYSTSAWWHDGLKIAYIVFNIHICTSIQQELCKFDKFIPRSRLYHWITELMSY